MSGGCQVCRTNSVEYRCPKCGKLICRDCASNGLCKECAYPPPPPSQNIQAQAQNIQTSTGQENVSVSRIGAALFGLFLPLIAMLTGLVMMVSSLTEEKRLFGKLCLVWGIVGMVVGFVLLMFIGLGAQPVME